MSGDFSRPAAPTVLTAIAVQCSRIGGMERYARELSLQLARHGWRSVLCFLSRPDGEVARFLSLSNVCLEEFPDLGSPRLPALRRFSRLLRQYRPRIVHLQFTPFLSPLPWVARLHGARAVYFTDQGSHPEGTLPTPSPMWKQAAGRLLTAPYAKVVSVSEFNRRMMAECGYIAENRTCCIHNATDVSPAGDPAAAAAFRQKFQIPADRILVVQVSWIIPEKGISDLIEAAAIAIERNPRLHFALVGEGSHRDEFSRKAEKLGLSGHITWTGLVRDPLGEGVFAAADIVCQLSRWQEAFGMVIAEAMGFGKPIVATRVGGIPEIVHDRHNGFLVPCRDVSAIADCFLQLADNPALRLQMGEASRVRSALFDVREKVSELLLLYGLPRLPPMVESGK